MSAGADDGVILDGTSDLNNADMLSFYLDGTTATNASMDFYSRKDSVNSTVSGVATVGTDFIRLGFSVKAGIVTVWVDGEKMGTVESNIPSDEELGIVWAISSDGTDGVPTLEIKLRSRIYGALNGSANPVGYRQHRCRGWRGGLGLADFRSTATLTRASSALTVQSKNLPSTVWSMNRIAALESRSPQDQSAK